MVTIYNENKRRLINLHGNAEALLRQICEENPKLFKKKTDEAKGKITFKSLGGTEAKTNIGYFYLWKNFVLDFEVS